MPRICVLPVVVCQAAVVALCAFAVSHFHGRAPGQSGNEKSTFVKFRWNCGIRGAYMGPAQLISATPVPHQVMVDRARSLVDA
eukprot:scaffold5747_cov128-Isochrysis_galbana.AAC.10